MARKQVKAKSRKEDKLRPYRVDYFDIDQMIDNDRALIRSSVVRATTSTEAIDKLIEALPSDGRIVIRAYRYYKKLGEPKRNVYKAIEDLFTANKAVTIMNIVEAHRKRKDIDAQFAAGFDRSSGVMGYESVANSTLPQDQKDRLLNQDENGHQTRFSDSSLYDEVCNLCGATDRGNDLRKPCPNAASTGPNSPATKAVVADLQGMTDHDAHEQTMETFVPTPGQPDISKFDLDAAAPVLNPAPESGDEIATALTATADIVRQRTWNDPMPGAPNIFPPEDRHTTTPMPLLAKLLVYGSVTLIAVIIVLALLSHGAK